MSDELVSIIVPVYNAESFIHDTVASIKSQTYENWEIILVDDGSTDNSGAILDAVAETDNRIRVIHREKSGGAALARNSGLDASKGRYITFLDADDLWAPEKLIRQLEFMDKNKCGFSFTAYEYATSDGIGVAKIVTVPRTITYRQALKNTTIFTSTVMFDTKVLNKDLIRMPNVPSEDSATWWQILRSGVTGYGMQQALTLYRRSGGTLSSNKIVAIKRIWNLYRNVEKLSLIRSAYCFCFYAFNAVWRRL